MAGKISHKRTANSWLPIAFTVLHSITSHRYHSWYYKTLEHLLPLLALGIYVAIISTLIIISIIVIIKFNLEFLG